MALPPPPRRSYEDAVRARLRSRRADLGLEQESVATRMRELGFSTWYRQTVGGVENGPRRITVPELLGLSLVLETSIASLMSPGPDAPRMLIELPNGQALPASAISSSAGVGMNEGWVRWDGDTVVWPAAETVEFMASSTDHLAAARDELDAEPRLPVPSEQEAQRTTRDAQTLVWRLLQQEGLISAEQAEALQAEMGAESTDSTDDIAARLRSQLGDEGMRALHLMSGIDVEQQFDPHIEEADPGTQPDPKHAGTTQRGQQ